MTPRGRTLAALLLALATTSAACGRVHFEVARDAGADAGRDAGPVPPSDTGPRDGGPGYCNPLEEATPEECADALVDSATALDLVLYQCARACLLGACTVLDRADCAACACNAYVKSAELCTPEGACSGVLEGSGCVGNGYYNRPPFNCVAGAVDEAACILRALIRDGYCDGG